MVQPIKRKRGGQPKPAGEAKSTSLTMRILPKTRRRLEREAKKSGRSVSGEAEYRIAQSFDREDVVQALRQVLEERR